MKLSFQITGMLECRQLRIYVVPEMQQLSRGLFLFFFLTNFHNFVNCPV